jgi:hypothetical protein
MVAATSEYLRHQLAGYAEGWKSDLRGSLAAWELEARLRTALALFDHVRRIDQQRTAELSAREETWTRESSAALTELYREWEAPSTMIAEQIASPQASGASVKGAEEFKQAVLQARAVLDVSLDGLEQSARQAREGRLRSVWEIRDELRRQAARSSRC